MSLSILQKKGVLTEAEANNIGELGKEVWAFDFETIYGGDLTLKKMSTWDYVQKADPYLVGLASSTGETYAGPLDGFDWLKLHEKDMVAHNAGFDELVLERAMRIGLIPEFKPASINCSLQACSFHGLPRSLAKATKHMFGRTVPKGMRDFMNGKCFEDAVAEGRAEELIEYAKQDAIHCLRIWLTLEKEFPPIERFIAEHTRQMESKGVHIDLNKVQESLEFFESEIKRLDQKIPWDAQGTRGKTMSPVRFKKYCMDHNLDVPSTTKKDAPEFVGWCNKYRGQHEIGDVFTEKRSVATAIGKLEKIQQNVRENGTLPVRMEYFGCYTGRWSSRGTNVQNFHKEKVAGVDMRSVIVPAKGHKFVIADLAQIEPRIIFHMAKDEETLDLIRSGMSIYEANARASGEYDGEDPLKLADPELYSSMKARVLGLGYGMGSERFKNECSKNGTSISLQEADEIKKKWRAANPLITDWWRKFEKVLKQAVSSNLKAKTAGKLPESLCYKLPSGRSFIWGDPKISTKNTSKISVLLPNNNHSKGGSFLEEETWGGTLFQNVVQATARDVLCDMMFRVEQAGYSIRFHVHDELIAEVPVEQAEKAYEDIIEIMSTPPEWMSTLPVEAEGGIYDEFTK